MLSLLFSYLLFINLFIINDNNDYTTNINIEGVVGGHVLSAVISVFVSPYMSIKTQHLLQGSNLN